MTRAAARRWWSTVALLGAALSGPAVWLLGPTAPAHAATVTVAWVLGPTLHVRGNDLADRLRPGGNASMLAGKFPVSVRFLIADASRRPFLHIVRGSEIIVVIALP